MTKKEGYLQKYTNFVRGYKKCYIKIRGYFLIVQKAKLKKDNKFKIDLRQDVSIEASFKDPTEFLISVVANSKPLKLYLKA